jgi:hypothetical protein
MSMLVIIAAQMASSDRKMCRLTDVANEVNF